MGDARRRWGPGGDGKPALSAEVKASPPARSSQHMSPHTLNQVSIQPVSRFALPPAKIADTDRLL